MKLAVYIHAPGTTSDEHSREYPATATSARAHGIGELVSRLEGLGHTKVVLDLGIDVFAHVYEGPVPPTAQQLGKVSPKVLQTSPLRPPGRRPADGWYNHGTHSRRFPMTKLTEEMKRHLRRDGGVWFTYFTEAHRPKGSQSFIVPHGPHRLMASAALAQAKIPEGADYVKVWIDPNSYFPTLFALVEDLVEGPPDTTP